MDEKSFKHVLLEVEQEQLLCNIVEAARNLPRENRQKFLVARSNDGDYLQHPGLPDGEIKFYNPDLEILNEKSFFIVVGVNRYGISRFDVHPRGFLYYKYLKERTGEPVEHVEKEVRDYIDSHDFQREYSKAYEKWVEAESLLWETETSKQSTKIGHLCREAIQEFMDTIYTQVNPPGETIPEQSTIKRLRAIIDVKSQKLGKTERRFLDVLINYWEAMNDLIQKQEHGAQKEKEQLMWNNARRVVFQTIILMYEVSRSLK